LTNLIKITYLSHTNQTKA